MIDTLSNIRSFYFDRGFTFHTHHAMNYSIQTQLYKRENISVICNVKNPKLISKARITSIFLQLTIWPCIRKNAFLMFSFGFFSTIFEWKSLINHPRISKVFFWASRSTNLLHLFFHNACTTFPLLQYLINFGLSIR